MFLHQIKCFKTYFFIIFATILCKSHNYKTKPNRQLIMESEEAISLSDAGRGKALLQLWSSFTTEERKSIFQNITSKSFHRGDCIYLSGTSPKYIMCLRRGRVKVIKDGIAGGHQQIVRILKPVEVFAYRAYLAGTDYITSAYAMDDCDISFIPLEFMTDMIKNNNQLMFFFLHHLSEELGFSDYRIISLTQKHVRGRLAEALLTLEDRCGLQDNGVIDVRISREELANLSNMTTNNAIRTLSAFAREGIVELNGKQIIILDHKKLEDISRFG